MRHWILRSNVQYSLSFRQIRSGILPWLRNGCHGKRRLRHLPRRLHTSWREIYSMSMGKNLQHYYPRSVSHVVWQPCHHAMVGRFVAQWVFCQYDLVYVFRLVRRSSRYWARMVYVLRLKFLGIKNRSSRHFSPYCCNMQIYWWCRRHFWWY